MNSNVEPNDNQIKEQNESLEQDSKAVGANEKDVRNGEIEIAEEAQQPDFQISPDPGSLLCSAREEKKLNRAQVGQRLGLTETAVKNLERNQFDYFPNAVYARGYLKNYAKFMDLNVDELVEMYDQYCHENGLETGKSHLKPASESESNSGGSTKLMVVLIVVVAIAAGIFYAYSNSGAWF